MAIKPEAVIAAISKREAEKREADRRDADIIEKVLDGYLLSQELSYGDRVRFSYGELPECPENISNETASMLKARYEKAGWRVKIGNLFVIFEMPEDPTSPGRVGG